MLLKVCLFVLLASAFAIRPRYHPRHHGGPSHKDMRELLSNLDEDAIMRKLKHMDDDTNDLYRNNKRYHHSHRDFEKGEEVLRQKKLHDVDIDKEEEKDFKILEIQAPASTTSEPATTTQNVTTQTQPPKTTKPTGSMILGVLFWIMKNQGNEIKRLSYLMKEMRLYMHAKYVSKAELYEIIKYGGVKRMPERQSRVE